VQVGERARADWGRLGTDETEPMSVAYLGTAARLLKKAISILSQIGRQINDVYIGERRGVLFRLLGTKYYKEIYTSYEVHVVQSTVNIQSAVVWN
jgi:hypothetical protein